MYCNNSLYRICGGLRGKKPQEVLRLHILANSDSKDDQTLKYDLRDYMLSTFSDVFGNCDSFSQSVAVANERRAEIEEKG